MSPIDSMHQTVWGMLYADDAYIASRLPRALEKNMKAIAHVYDVFGLTVLQETQTMPMPVPIFHR